MVSCIPLSQLLTVLLLPEMLVQRACLLVSVLVQFVLTREGMTTRDLSVQLATAAWHKPHANLHAYRYAPTPAMPCPILTYMLLRAAMPCPVLISRMLLRVCMLHACRGPALY